MTRLPNLAARVRRIADRAIIGDRSHEQHSAAAISATDRTRLVEWSAAGLECVTLMLTAPALHNTSRIENVKSGLRALVEGMERVRAQLPQALQSEIGGMHDDILQFGLGATSLLEARRIQIETESAIQTALGLIRQTSAAFVASVSAISGATQRDIASRSAFVNETVSNSILLSIATSLLCLSAIAGILLYMRRAVIARLKVLQQYMRAQVEGRPAAISTAGQDEIAEMAKATQFFVTRIADREAVLRGVFDNMAGAVLMFDRNLKMAAWNREFVRDCSTCRRSSFAARGISPTSFAFSPKGRIRPGRRGRAGSPLCCVCRRASHLRENSAQRHGVAGPAQSAARRRLCLDLHGYHGTEEAGGSPGRSQEGGRGCARRSRTGARGGCSGTWRCRAGARGDAEILDNMSDGIVLFDKDLRLKFMNHQAHDVPAVFARCGATRAPRCYDLLRFQAERGDFGPSG